MTTAILLTLMVTAPGPALGAAASTGPLAADTIFAVESGTRLAVDNFRGEVTIRGWDRDEVRVRADLSSRQTLDVVRSGSAYRVRPRTERGGHQEADLTLDVPRWMDLRIEGNQLHVDIQGARGEIHVENVGGDIAVSDAAGLLTLRSIQGEVVVRGTAGPVDVVSVNEDIGLTDVQGDIYVETTNGDITLRGIRSASSRSSTVNGDIVYQGEIRTGGRYVFGTHNGDVVLTTPDGTSATVSVSSYHGEFESEFPVRLTGTTRDRQFTFTLGSGSARIELESFNGDILLRRP